MHSSTPTSRRHAADHWAGTTGLRPADHQVGSTGAQRSLVAVLLLVLTLTGCSVRLDVPPDPIPTPDATEQARAALAEQTETLIDFARAAGGGEPAADRTEDGGGNPHLAAELSAIAEASEDQLAALGGLWTPPPRPDDPSPTPTAEPTATAQDVLTALTDAASQARDAVGEPVWDPDAATLLASIAVYRDGAVARLSHLLGADAPTPPEPVTELPAELDATSAPLCRTLDGLGYAYEVQAARSSGEQRSQAVARAEQNRALAERVAVLAGYDGTVDDPRQASYAVGEDLGETITAWQTELVPAWLALVGPADPADRVLLLEHLRWAAALAPLPSGAAFPGLQTD